ncbi:hypothetical protein GOEFS_098_00140 [Gordonia effusa NBRC 100432]|uniref:Uncharacterized protein n=1 Tax=Gordonia effusa NBRC 100432 TaxID=1077974 RepID=H0R4E7_9ACTN|nr:hypothetical protein GOEFS_098_00140 [Gordonia effusa NBRC 100432]
MRTFGIDPGDAIDVGQHKMFFDVSAQIKREIFSATTVGEVGDELTGDGVQPGQSLVTVEFENGAVGAVDDHRAGRRGSLLTKRIAKMPSNTSGVIAGRRLGDSSRSGKSIENRRRGHGRKPTRDTRL